MRASKKVALAVSFGAYWVASFVVLFFFSLDNDFCSRPVAHNHIIATAQFAFALALFDSAVSNGVGMMIPRLSQIPATWFSTLLTTLIVGSGIACLPLWIYRGYGHFRFENTWMDVSCFFTEGYGMVFPFTVAPLLALLTFLTEVLIRQPRRPRDADTASFA